MKHVGKMKNNGARVLIVYRTLPGDSRHALVVGSESLNPAQHDEIMDLLQSVDGQNANEFADALAVRRFTFDGTEMLVWLHTNKLLKRVPTDGVIVTPATNYTIPLDELNATIAEQRGVTVDELAVTNGATPNPRTPRQNPDDIFKPLTEDVESLTASQLRERADRLWSIAHSMQTRAEEMDPTKRVVPVVVDEEGSVELQTVKETVQTTTKPSKRLTAKERVGETVSK